ncbi:MAG: hypothetical protein H7Z37_06150, partial [Pyrinomonadaceae bacterium]|nr:hypothetical protein [Pyrinomonadaceae bacterium]
MYELLNDLWKSQSVLMLTAFGFAALFIALAIISIFDNSQILNVNRWIKPMKFASSIVVYLATLAVYLHYLRGHETSKSVIAWTAVLTMLGEIVLIIMQTVRGTTSHFNNTSAFNSMVFSTMGLLIVINTLMIIWLTVLYFQADSDLPTALAWGMRLGLVVFVIGSVEGGYMATQIG